MAEFKRDKRLHRAFHSTDSDALEILMNHYNETFPGMPEEQQMEIQSQAQEAIEQAQTTNSWFLIAPDGTIQMVSAKAMVLMYEDSDSDIWHDVQKERVRQVIQGYDVDNDDAVGTEALLARAMERLEEVSSDSTADVHAELVKITAILVAAIERVERDFTKGGTTGKMTTPPDATEVHDNGIVEDVAEDEQA